jgi:spore germination cell wall hydrolase CwlJ-like protein
MIALLILQLGLTNPDLDLGARTIAAEAGTEGFVGQMLVAHVIINRVEAQHRAENTISGVVLEPKQFSCWNLDDNGRKRMQSMTANDRVYRVALRALLTVLEERPRDPTGGALHYFNPKLANPPWARGQTPYLVHGNHAFYVGIK